MRTERHLFPNPVKWLDFSYNWHVIAPASLSLGIAVASASCVTVDDATLEYRDGVLYACYDATHMDKCYKVKDNNPEPNGTKAPE